MESRVVTGRHRITLDAGTSTKLPSKTRTVIFQCGQDSQQHVETGPTLASVLKAAGIRPTKATTVAPIAADGYVATVPLTEATSGRRPLLLSVTEDGAPLEGSRLVTDGDVFGACYVSGVVALEIDRKQTN